MDLKKRDKTLCGVALVSPWTDENELLEYFFYAPYIFHLCNTIYYIIYWAMSSWP